jgi:hypothetical protein
MRRRDMPIQKPEDVIEVATQTFNSGDVDAHMAIYEPDACFNFEPGHLTATGIPAIREAFTEPVPKFLSQLRG